MVRSMNEHIAIWTNEKIDRYMDEICMDKQMDEWMD